MNNINFKYYNQYYYNPHKYIENNYYISFLIEKESFSCGKLLLKNINENNNQEENIIIREEESEVEMVTDPNPELE